MAQPHQLNGLPAPENRDEILPCVWASGITEGRTDQSYLK